MQKKTIIKRIRKIISEFGGFQIGELDGVETSPCVGSLGNYVGLAEGFNRSGIEVSVYMPSGFSSDAEDEYTLTYEELNKDILEEILLLCEQYEAEQIQTEKRISN